MVNAYGGKIHENTLSDYSKILDRTQLARRHAT